MANLTDKFSAGAQGLGYIYQVRLALLRLLQLPENTAVSLEKDDDPILSTVAVANLWSPLSISQRR